MTDHHDRAVLAAVRDLVAQGFALHWLHPRTKRPIGNDWSTKPVWTLAQLQGQHVPGANLGVRLGEPSKVSGYYLQVIDVDIRLPECREEALEALYAAFPMLQDASFPIVRSGSGGASFHIYFLTDRPFDSRKFAKSEGKHRGADGKWHHDWELELFGTGKQVAMPPSIHPDTGKPYTWQVPFDVTELLIGGGPVIAADHVATLATETDETYEYETRPPLEFKPGQLERDLDAISLDHLDDYFDWVMLGQALHHQFGAAQEGFDLWVEHSKRSQKFDGSPKGLREMRQKWRGFGRNRKQPVTMATVRMWAQDARAQALANEFDDLDSFDTTDMGNPVTEQNQAVDDDLLGIPDEGIATADPLADVDDIADLPDQEDDGPAPSDWMRLLDLNEEGGIKSTAGNIELILRHDERTAGLIQVNRFTQELVQRRTPGTKQARRKNAAKPTKQLAGPIWQVRDSINGDLWSEDRDFHLRIVIEAPKTQGGYGIKVSDRDLKAAIAVLGQDNGFHPIREYLDAQAWDGVPRVEQLFIRFLGAPDDAYSRSAARMMMVGAVSRIFEPGMKFDFAVILEGLQGKGKSTFIETLAKHWFAELDGDFHDSKQMVELMQGAWILEIPELTGFGRADVRAIKAFISRKKDRVRLAYARRAGEYPRQCIFIGSTNDKEYLKDDTGGRRFWPVACAVEEIDIAGLEVIVDQLWGEAVAIYRQMRAAQPKGRLPLFLANAEAKRIAVRLQESRRVESVDDAMLGEIEAWLEAPLPVGFDGGEATPRIVTCLKEVWTDCLGNDPKTYSNQASQMLGRVMRRVAGWDTEGEQHRFPKWGKQRYYFKVSEKRNLAAHLLEIG